MIYSITWMLFWVLKPIGQESNSMYGISNRYSLQDKSDGEFSNDRGGDDGYDGGVLLSTLNNCPTGDLTIGQPPCPGLCRIFPDTIWRGGQTLFYHHLPCWAPELPPPPLQGGALWSLQHDLWTPFDPPPQDHDSFAPCVRKAECICYKDFSIHLSDIFQTKAGKLKERHERKEEMREGLSTY